jgi:hypothetical protein
MDEYSSLSHTEWECCPAARSLVTSRAATIGVVVNATIAGLFAAGEPDGSVIPGNSDAGPRLDRKVVRAFDERRAGANYAAEFALAHRSSVKSSAGQLRFGGALGRAAV